MSLDLSEQYDKIYRYCYFKVNDRCAAEDLAQETFLRYFSHTPYISRGKQLAYLYTIARNLCVDYYRNPRRDEELLGEANKWELSHGGLSGRSAQQFIDYILGCAPKD